MVRGLRLPFALKKTDLGLEATSESESTVVALARAEPNIEDEMTYALARIPIPFWCVQISEHESIILSAITDEPQIFEFTNNKKVGTIKRMLRSDMDSWQTIPESAEHILPLIGSIEKEVNYMKGLVNPSVFLPVGNHFSEQEGQKSTQVLNEIIDSHIALDTSEQFQEVLDSRKIRLESIQEIQQLLEKKLETETKKLDNFIERERERTEQRTRNLHEIADIEISMLKEEEEEQLEKLEQEETVGLRALTAEFARSTNQLEIFFSKDILEKIRKQRSNIGRSKSDVESATSHFDELAEYLHNNVHEYEEIISELNSESERILARKKEIRQSYEDKRDKIHDEINVQIRNHQHRIVEFDLERDQAENKLLEARARLDDASERLIETIEERVHMLKEELRNLQEFAFKSVNIPGLASLTKLNIEAFLHNQNERLEIMTPCIIPEEGVTLGLECEETNHELSSFLREMVENRIDSRMSFANELERVCISGNLFLAPQMSEALQEGVDELHHSGLLESHRKRALTKRFSLRARRCPYCGAEIAESIRFCGECGKLLQ